MPIAGCGRAAFLIGMGLIRGPDGRVLRFGWLSGQPAAQRAVAAQEGNAMVDDDARAMADRFLIRELIDAYSNMCTRKALSGLGDLFVEDCIWRTRGENMREFRGRSAVVAAIGAVVEGYPLIFQMPHAPHIVVDGERATATTLMHEFGRLDATTTAFTYAVYHDVLVRTPQGWRFAERVFEAVHQETATLPPG